MQLWSQKAAHKGFKIVKSLAQLQLREREKRERESECTGNHRQDATLMKP